MSSSSSHESLLQSVLRHGRIARRYAAIGIVRRAQFRTEFFSQVIMDIVFYGVHVALFEFLYRHVDNVAGWTIHDVRVFLGWLFLSDAFMMVWMSNAWMLPEDLKNGNLDTVRVRPVQPAFLYLFQKFSLEACVNALIALGWLLWAIDAHPQGWTPWQAPLFVWCVLVCCMGRAAVMTLFSTVEFIWVNGELSRVLNLLAVDVNDHPLDVYGRRGRAFLLYMLPLGAMNYAAASMWLGKCAQAEAVALSVFVPTLMVLSFALFARMFRRYESAMS